MHVPPTNRHSAPHRVRHRPSVLGAIGYIIAIHGVGCAPGGVRPPRLTADQQRLNVESFDYVWSTVEQAHWDRDLVETKWRPARDEFRTRVAAATVATEARAATEAMIDRLEQTHFGIIPADAYDDIDKPANSSPASDGDAGIHVRLLDGRVIVTALDPRSAAEEADIRPGWEIRTIGRDDVSKLLGRLETNIEPGSAQRLLMTRAVTSRLRGDVGERVALVLLDEGNREVEREVTLAAARGKRVHFGHLPRFHVWFESRRLDGGVGYIAFNGFFDPQSVLTPFGEAVRSFADARGIIIDLRGNPGGIGAMAMGVASWFFKNETRRLGVMHTRDQELKFTVSPRVDAYLGPVAILVDELTGSTAEILAGGMKDLGRAVIIGTRTAGAALPSRIDRLPNGDGFQYAVANYLSAGGQALEDNGVTPDLEAPHTREALLAGRDLAINAAVWWIQSSGGERRTVERND
ncbi:MAG: hypothetical protein HOP29_14405 [Phycisphaerales bacterium]|nr:hypothetical protein [Phycisphaerales bacterium]